MAEEQNLIRECPECGHYTGQAVGGRCTVFVPGPPGGPWAVMCHHDCYKAMTGKSLMEKFAETWKKGNA